MTTTLNDSAAQYEQIQEQIERNGYALVQMVNEQEENMACFTQSVGLTEKGWPEVFVHNNLPGDLQHQLLTNLIHRWLAAGVPDYGLQEQLGNVLMRDGIVPMRAFVRLVPESPEASLYTSLGHSTYGGVLAVSVAQLVVPCRDNLLPWEEGYNKNCSLRQIVLPGLLGDPKQEG